MSRIAVFSFCLIICANVILVSAQFACQETHGLHAHENCKKFWHCSNGIPHEMDCAPGTAWNDNIKVCDWPSNGACDQNEPSSTAPEETTTEGNTGSEETTTQEATTSDDSTTSGEENTTQGSTETEEPSTDGSNTTTEPSTADGETTNEQPITSEEPTTPDDSTTADSSPDEGITITLPNIPDETTLGPSDFVCPEPNGLFAHKVCTKFWACSNNIAYEMDCAPETAWNDAIKVCDWPSAVKCKLNPKENACKESGALYQDKYDCRHYYECDQTLRSYRKACSDGLYFNQEKQMCDLAQNVRCFDGSNDAIWLKRTIFDKIKK